MRLTLSNKTLKKALPYQRFNQLYRNRVKIYHYAVSYLKNGKLIKNDVEYGFVFVSSHNAHTKKYFRNLVNPNQI